MCYHCARLFLTYAHTHVSRRVYSAGMADLGLNRELSYKLSTTTT